MKKSFLVFLLCFVLMFAVAAVSAQDAEPVEGAVDGFKVTYLENDCLAEVPTDEKTYAAGEEVTALFEPVAYKDYLIFFGWDLDDDGIADLGYNFDKFTMPEKDAELKAICIGAGGGSAGKTCKDCGLRGPKPGPGLSTFSFSYGSYSSSSGTGN